MGVLGEGVGWRGGGGWALLVLIKVRLKQIDEQAGEREDCLVVVAGRAALADDDGRTLVLPYTGSWCSPGELASLVSRCHLAAAAMASLMSMNAVP